MSIESRVDKENRIRELREAIARLETELQRDIEAEQHDLIDRLDEHFDAVETKLSSLRTFWMKLKRDLGQAHQG
jgi:predicted nuclease with TOPRIM domain